MTAERTTRVVLIGLRASGKSTVVKLLAERFHTEAIDIDTEIARDTGVSHAADFIRAHGWKAFRAAEAQALARAISEPAHLIALGGGTPTAPGADDLLREAIAGGSAVFYIRCNPETLGARLASDPNSDRPSLTRGDSEQVSAVDEMAAVFAERDPLYQSIATQTIQADALSPTEIRDRILASLD